MATLCVVNRSRQRLSIGWSQRMRRMIAMKGSPIVVFVMRRTTDTGTLVLLLNRICSGQQLPLPPRLWPRLYIPDRGLYPVVTAGIFVVPAPLEPAIDQPGLLLPRDELVMTSTRKPISCSAGVGTVNPPTPTPRRFTLAGLMFLVSTRLAGVASPSFAEKVQVAVAGNCAVPMEKIASAFERETGHTAVLSFGATGALYAQIIHGAPFLVFLSADQTTPLRLAR